MIQIRPGTFLTHPKKVKRKLINLKGHHNDFKREICSPRKSNLKNARLADKFNFYQESKLTKLLQMVYQRVRQHNCPICSTNNPQTMFRPPQFKRRIFCHVPYLQKIVIQLKAASITGRYCFEILSLESSEHVCPSVSHVIFTYDETRQKSCLHLTLQFNQIMQYNFGMDLLHPGK